MTLRSRLKIFLTKEGFLARAGLIFLIGFIVRLIYLAIHGASGNYDTIDYLKLADNLYNFGAFSLSNPPDFIPSVRRPPAYSYFLAFLKFFGEGKEALQLNAALVQCVLDALTATAVWGLARKVVTARIAVGTALFYVFHPGALARVNLTLTETFFTFWLVTGVLVLVTAVEREKIRLLALGSFMLGVAVLTRPLGIVVPVLFAFAVWTTFEHRKKYKFITTFALFLLLALAPWLLRCYQISGQFIFVQGVTAFQFYAPTRVDLEQWNEEKLWREFFDPQTNDEYFRKFAAAETPRDFIEAERVGRQKAIENVRWQPKEYVISRLKIYPHFFISSFDSFTGFNKSFAALLAEGSLLVFFVKALLMALFSLLPLFLSLAGLLRVSQNLTALFCASLWISVLLLHLPMWIEYRFWVPFVPFQIVSAAAGLAVLQSRFRREKTAES